MDLKAKTVAMRFILSLRFTCIPVAQNAYFIIIIITIIIYITHTHRFELQFIIDLAVSKFLDNVI